MGAAEAIAFAQAQLGKPYVFGATGPNSYDCSGLTYKAAAAGGVKIGRTTAQQIFNGSNVGKDALQPGDLVFPDPGHVQLYVGNQQVIEAPHTGAFVRLTTMWGFWQARRIFDVSATATSAFVTVGNPVTDTGNVLANLESISTKLIDPNLWKRVSVGVFGAGLIVAAILFFNRDEVMQQIKTGTKAAEIGAAL